MVVRAGIMRTRTVVRANAPIPRSVRPVAVVRITPVAVIAVIAVMPVGSPTVIIEPRIPPSIIPRVIPRIETVPRPIPVRPVVRITETPEIRIIPGVPVIIVEPTHPARVFIVVVLLHHVGSGIDGQRVEHVALP